ncbi:unnamed protein product [Urochloa decumbens]|uniref:Disease resistance protein RPM1 n=1 Tax=Urochloa decumbens TaxID=240449 RepID=A0ABC9AN42_9POAL
MDLVAGASKFAVNNLGSFLAPEYTLIRGARDDIQYITDELSSMQAFLNRLKRAGHNDEQQEDWMNQVRGVAEDIEDYVDYVRLRLGREPRGHGTVMRVRRAWYLFTTLYARHCIATEIRNLKVRAQHVSERRTRYGVENLPRAGRRRRGGNGSSSGGRHNTPKDCPAAPLKLVSNKAPVGLEDAMQMLESWFLEMEYTNSSVSFLAITGVGGIGKTTLAMALYHKFGDRYLFLIDDIWSVSALEQIRDSLAKTQMGGTIVVTTKFKSVAEACRRQQGYVFEHMPLHEGNTYSMFLEIICSAAYNLCPTRPINGWIIRKTCGGLPLAIVLVAGLVASKLKSDPQFNIDNHLAQMAEDIGEALRDNFTAEGIMAHILNHCCNDLTAEQKTCLLYMSMFPKGCLISRQRLIRRWIAERFIIKKHGKTTEEVAEDLFNELIFRNLIQPITYNSNGKVKRCIIHGMVLEYIVSKSRDENFVAVVGGHWQMSFPRDDRNLGVNMKMKVRWLSIQNSYRQEKETVARMKPSHVRSVMLLGSFQALSSTLVRFQILEVLDLEDCKDLSIKHLKKVCEMRQLKYLNLRRTDINGIPDNIGNLEYLEVLDIRETNVRELPGTVENLQRMVHLLAGDKIKRIGLRLTAGITKMMTLQTLSGVEISGRSVTSSADGRNGCCYQWRYGCKVSTGFYEELEVVMTLENLINLKKLTIYKLGRFDYCEEMLVSVIEHLSYCSLKFLEIFDDFGFHDGALNASQAPPEHLQTLGLLGLLFQLPKWIARLHNLEKLTLSLTSLTTDALVVLAQLPELFSLIFSLDAAKGNPSVIKIMHNNTLKSGGMIFVPAGGFTKLKLLRFVAPLLPPLSFLEGSMPELMRIELRFRMVGAVYGLENLASIQQVVLTVNSQAPRAARAKASEIKELASMMVNAPIVVIDEYSA